MKTDNPAPLSFSQGKNMTFFFFFVLGIYLLSKYINYRIGQDRKSRVPYKVKPQPKTLDFQECLDEANRNYNKSRGVDPNARDVRLIRDPAKVEKMKREAALRDTYFNVRTNLRAARSKGKEKRLFIRPDGSTYEK